MAWPGKSIFDVTMMAGWAFAAVLTGLVALTMVDDPDDSANRSSVASLDNADARLVTGSIESISPAKAEGLNDHDSQESLVAQQNQSFDPFSKKNQGTSQQLQELITELRSLKQEVAAFHVTTQRLRDENDRLKQRLVKLELDGPETQTGVRVVDLPRRNDSRNPFVLSNGQTTQAIDTQSTGSIGRSVGALPDGEKYDPFATPSQPNIKISEQPLTMDFESIPTSQGVMLPREKPEELVHPASGANIDESGKLRPVSQIVSSPAVSQPASRTAFGLDLGAFVSISDIRAAWREISSNQKSIVGDLRPLSLVTERKDGHLALKLILGPIPNAAQAASVCAQLNYANYDCSVSAYRGQTIALN
nr:SPOR domain-containing protein [uncultured Cohaesibacter sp.]